MQPIKLEEMSVEALKALAYDQLVLLEQTQNNIKVINQAIAKKSEVKEEVKEEKETK